MGRIITAPGVLANVQGQIDHMSDIYQEIKDNNLKPLTITIDPVTNANGAYSHTTEDDRITEDMKALTLELGTPEVFSAPITITSGEGTVTLVCDNAHGTSTVTVTFIHTWPVDGGEDVPASVTSTEFDILADRIGVLSNLETGDKTSIVNAINDLQDDVNSTITSTAQTLNQSITSNTQAIATLNSKITTPPVTYTAYADVKSGIASKAASMASGSIASFDFHANYSTAEELPGAYYTCILRKYDNNSYVADIISNVGADYKLTYAGNTWRITSQSQHTTYTTLAYTTKIPSTATTYNLSESFMNFNFLLVEIMQYDNVWASCFVTTAYFNNTSSSGRIVAKYPLDASTIGAFQVYKASNTQFVAIGTGSDFNTDAYHVRISGCFRK